MVNQDKLRRMLDPRHVAFVGGGTMADAAIACRKSGFKGEVWLVNPRHETINGEVCYASIANLPEAPDATFIGTNRDLTITVVRDLNRAGAAGAVCYASGFAETGPEGEQLQQQLLEAAGDMPIIGPNCYGMLDYLHGAALWPVAHGRSNVDKGVAVLTQSGNFAYNLSMIDSTLPIAYLISVGNQSQVEVSDLIEALLHEPRVTAIGIHLEGLKNVSAFADAAYHALVQGIPVVVLKTGTSEIGAELALSHTSSLAGSDDLYSALFDRVGVIRVDGPVSFVETLKILSSGNIPPGRRLAALASSGGDAGLIADLCERHGLSLTSLNQDQHHILSEILPDFAHVANPLDFTTAVWGNEQALTLCAETMLDGEVDFGLLVLDYPSDASGEQEACNLMAQVFGRALVKKNSPGAIASVFPQLMPKAAQEKLFNTGIPALAGLEDGIKAIANVAKYSELRSKILADLKPAEAAILTIPRQLGAVRNFDEWQSKQLLAPYGLNVPSARLVPPDQAAEAAEELGFPVVLKVVSADLLHKTDAGAVILNLQTKGDVATAAAELVDRLATSHPHVDCSLILVEKMSARPIAELIIGIKREPGFGLALIIGAGGILVELVSDSASLLLPTTKKAVTESLQNLKIYKLLKGFRGQAGCDMDQVVTAVMAVAAFAADHADRLQELDVNPLLVSENGAIAVDALIRMVDLD